MLQDKSLKVIESNTTLALSDSSFEDLALGTVIKIFSLDDIIIDSELDLLAAAERYFMARNEALIEDIIVILSASNTPSLDILPQNNSDTVDVNKNKEKEHEVKSGAKGTTENIEDTPKPNNEFIKNEEDKETEKNQDTSPSATLPQQKEGDRTRSEATLRFTVQNLTNLEEEVLSPSCYIRQMPWEILVQPNYKNEQKKKQLGVYLQCNSSSKSMIWSCVAKADIRLIPQIPDAKQFQCVWNDLYSGHRRKWGHCSFMAWDDVLDPKRGFIKDDSIILEAHVTVEEPEGLSWGSKKHTRYFATFGVEVRSVLYEIRFLTLTANELAEYKPKMSLLTDEDMLALFMNIASNSKQKPMPFRFSTCRKIRSYIDDYYDDYYNYDRDFDDSDDY